MIRKLWQKWRQVPWQWRWTIFTTFILVTFYSVENFRGSYALREYREKWESEGEWFSFADRPRPPRGPDADNLLAHPDVIEALSNDGDRFALRNLDDLHATLATATQNQGRQSCSFYPFDKAFESDPPITREEGAKRYLSKIEEWTEGLDQFRNAADQSKSIRADDDELLVSAEFPYLSGLRNTAFTLNYRAEASIACDQIDRAAADILAILQVGDLLYERDSLIEQLVATALHGKALQPLWDGLKLRKWNEKQLAEFAQRLPLGKSADLTRETFMFERGYGIHSFETFDSFLERFDQATNVGTGNPYSSAFFNFDIPDILPFDEALETIGTGILFCIVPDGWFDLWKIQISENSRQGMFETAVQNPVPLYSKIWKLPDDFTVEYDNFIKMRRHHLTDLGLAAAAVAIERYHLEYGRYPERLEDLVPKYLPQVPPDHFSGKPIIYLRAGERSERPVIYSYGRNEIDDGGFPARDKKKGDLVWQYDLPGGFSIDDFYDSKIP